MALTTLACAARGPSPALVAEAGRAESLVAAGCYRCLEEAFFTFERLVSAPNPPPAAARAAWTTAVLLIVRSKELGLPADAWAQHAEKLSARLSPLPGELPPRVYLDAVMLIGGEASGFSPDERESRGRERRALLGNTGQTPASREALAAALPADRLAHYVALAIDCEDAARRKTMDFAALRQAASSPLLQFRLALCTGDIDRMTALREADPRWIDTAFFEGRREMTRYPEPDVSRATELYALAHDAFPASTAITLALAHARNALSEYDSALELFDGVLETYPRHHDAWLGRVLSLSYLERHNDAIRSATRLLELGMFHQGDAYYWRAWNRYRVHQLPAAEADVTDAMKLMVNTSVYTLAGFIAYAQQQLDTAIERLERAYRLDQTNCEAVWTEALIHVDKQDWTPASARFSTGTACFAEAGEQARRDIAVAEASTWAAAVKVRRLAAAQKRLDTSEHRRAQSAYNAAGTYARLGRKIEALAYLDIAATHPLLKDKAAGLRASVEKLPQ